MSTLGAIRWDAHNLGTLGVAESVILSPATWHSRLPFCGQEVDATTVINNSDTQAIRDAEIEMAYRNGIDYWAFGLYCNEPNWPLQGRGNGNTDGMNNGYRRYLTSTKIGLVKHCFLLVGGYWCFERYGTNPPMAAQFDDFSTQLVAMIVAGGTNYQTVLSGRPLVYCFANSGFVSMQGGDTPARTAMDLFRTKCTNAGLGNPYLVSMDGSSAVATTLGMDAVSAYATTGSPGGAAEYSYATLTAAVEASWAAQKAVPFKVCPNIMAGWDYRPRNGWVGQYPHVGAEDTASFYFTTPTPAQFKAHVQAGLDWIAANPTDAEAGTAIIYAWNEVSEGGWIEPSRTDYGQRLQSIAALRNLQREPRRNYRARGVAVTSR